jgi:hypothetical protein
MAPVLTDPVDRRLRAARPEAAEVAADVAERPEAQALMACVRSEPVEPRRRHGRPLPRRAAAALALAAAGVVALTGLPGSDTGPQPALAGPISMAVRWFDPAPGTVLHYRNTLTSSTPNGWTGTLRQEGWQSVEHPDQSRLMSVHDGIPAESARDGIYDPATDTVYLNVPPGRHQLAKLERAIALKIAAARDDGVSQQDIARMRRDARQAIERNAGAADGSASRPTAGDPSVAEIRTALEQRRARVTGRDSQGGIEAYVIELDPQGPTVRWTLRTAVSDGRPLALRIDNGPGTPALETISWQTYEVLPGGESQQLVTVRGAHPGARLVRDADALDAATARLYPSG